MKQPIKVPIKLQWQFVMLGLLMPVLAVSLVKPKQSPFRDIASEKNEQPVEAEVEPDFETAQISSGFDSFFNDAPDEQWLQWSGGVVETGIAAYLMKTGILKNTKIDPAEYRAWKEASDWKQKVASAPTSQEQRATALDHWKSKLQERNADVAKGVKVNKAELKALEDRINYYATATLMSDKEKIRALKAAEKTELEAMKALQKVATSKKVLAIRAAKVVSGGILVWDVYNRVHLWRSVNADPRWSPVGYAGWQVGKNAWNGAWNKILGREKTAIGNGPAKAGQVKKKASSTSEFLNEFDKKHGIAEAVKKSEKLVEENAYPVKNPEESNSGGNGGHADLAPEPSPYE